MKVTNPGSIVNVTYKDYTSTSNLSGISNSTNEADSLISVIKNNTFVYQISILKESENQFNKD